MLEGCRREGAWQRKVYISVLLLYYPLTFDNTSRLESTIFSIFLPTLYHSPNISLAPDSCICMSLTNQGTLNLLLLRKKQRAALCEPAAINAGNELLDRLTRG